VTDLVNHPPHYTGHPSGVECIEITEHFGFNLGNAIKYIWRADAKGDAIADLEKAAWYIERELHRRTEDAPHEYPQLPFEVEDMIRASVPVEDLRFDSPTPLSDSINQGVRASA
jgi:hypothetical protein